MHNLKRRDAGACAVAAVANLDSLESELKIGVVEELYAVSVDLYDTKLRLRDVLETSLQVLLVSYPQAGTGVACDSLRPTKSADEPLETCSNIPCIEMVCRRSH